MTTNDKKIDLSLSPEALRSIQQFRAELAASLDHVLDMRKGLKQVQDVLKAASFRGMASGQGGLNQYQTGAQFRQNAQIEATRRLGTLIGQQIQLQRIQLQLAQQGLKFTQDSTRMEEARNLNLRTAVTHATKLNDIAELTNRLEAARLRLGMEAANGNAREVQRAQQLIQALQQQLAIVRERKKEEDALARRNPNGTAAGARGVVASDQTRAGQTALRQAEQLRLLTEARALNLRSISQTVGRIRTVEEATRMSKLLQVRAEAEMAQGQTRRAQTALSIRERLQEQLRTLQEQARVQERIQNLQNPNRRLLRAQAGFAREATNERLFGDGGAHLFGIQAGLGLNYMIMNQLQGGLRNAGTFTVELDQALRNLQAITVTTDNNMMHLRETLIGISEETKFTAVDITNAAITLGQAGLNTTEIEEAARAVGLLATATGTDLPRAVDIATSVLGAFEMEAGQIGTIADIMTEAVNSSKLDLEKLTLGIQYSGNIAAQNGLRFDELTAALGAMANAGIRSGSTLGTGMRQILISMMDPSEEFVEVLHRLGLTTEDVDVQTQGLYGAMANLRDAGFTAADAVRVFEVRAASAYNALSGNLDQMLDLQTAFQGTTASAQANETQMRSFSNQWARFGSVIGSVAAESLEPVKVVLTQFISLLSDSLEVLRNYPGTLRLVGTGFTVLGVSLAALRLASLTAGLAAMARNLIMTATAARTAATATTAVAAAQTAATASTLSLGMALRVAMGPLGILAGVVAAGTLAILSLGDESFRLADAIDQAQSAVDRSQGALDEWTQKISTVDQEIENLVNRQDRLAQGGRDLTAEIERIKLQFSSMGLDVTNVADNVEGLIAQMRELRAELSERYVMQLEVASGSLEAMQNALTNQYEVQRRSLVESINQAVMNNTDPNTGESSLGFGSMLQGVSPVLQQGVSLEQAQFVQNNIQEQINQRERERLEEENTVFVDRYDLLTSEIEFLRMLQPQIADMITNLRDQRRTTEALALNGQTTADAVNRQSPGVVDLYSGAEELNAGVSRWITAAASTAGNNDALGQFEAARTVYDQIMAEQEQLQFQLDEMVAAGTVTANNALAIQTLIETIKSSAEAAFTPLAEAAAEVNESIISGTEQRLREAARRAASAIGDATTEPEARAAQAAFQRSLDAYRSAATRRVQQTIADVSERNAAMGDLEQELARMQEDATAEFTETVEKIAEGEEDRQLETLQEQERAADAAYDRAVRLAEAAETLHERNQFLTEAMAALRRRLAAALAIIGIEFADNPEAGAAATESVQTKYEEDSDAVTNLGNGRNRDGTPRRERGGTGGMNDPVNRWIAQATAAATSVFEMIKQGIFEGEDGAGSIETLLEEARTQMQGIVAEMASLRQRAVNGTLSREEQERLNQLVQQHGNLAQFVNQQEEHLVEIYYRQGEVLEGVRLQAQRFAAQNLDAATNLAQGISGVFDTMTNSLMEFFDSWSSGTKSGKEAFRDLAASVIRSIQQIFVRMLAVYAMQRIMGLIFPGANIPQQSFGQIAGGMMGMREGGKVPRRAAVGERVRGNVSRDSQPYLLMPNEYVLRASAAQAIGYENLDQLNALGNKTVSRSNHSGLVSSQEKQKKPDTNIYLVDERSRAPATSPTDIVAIISDNIHTGGPIKKLIKAVATDQF